MPPLQMPVVIVYVVATLLVALGALRFAFAKWWNRPRYHRLVALAWVGLGIILVVGERFWK